MLAKSQMSRTNKFYPLRRRWWSCGSMPNEKTCDIATEYIEKKSAKATRSPDFWQNASAEIEQKRRQYTRLAPRRLARNSVDGGQIVYLLDSGKLGTLKFPTFWFENTSQGKFMLVYCLWTVKILCRQSCRKHQARFTPKSQARRVPGLCAYRLYK